MEFRLLLGSLKPPGAHVELKVGVFFPEVEGIYKIELELHDFGYQVRGPRLQL